MRPKWSVMMLVLASCWGTGAEPFRLVSQRSPSQPAPAGGSGDSWGVVLSPDGRYAIFASTANNLAMGNLNAALPACLHPKFNVYWRDRSNGITMLISQNFLGTAGGNGDSLPRAISANGQYILFESEAEDLVPGDTNGLRDVFVRDLQANTTHLVSVSTNGGPVNGPCRSAVMTPDGRHVAFVSEGNNLTANDTNAIADVFVRDLQRALTVHVSAGAGATNAVTPLGSVTAPASDSPLISADGRYVAFYSTAMNLLPGVDRAPEIYLHDLVSGTIAWVSVDSRALFGSSNVSSFNHAMSGDGAFVAFQVSTNKPRDQADLRGVLLRFSRDTGATEVISTNAWVQDAALPDIRSLDISDDGRFVAYVERAADFGETCLWLWDGQTRSNRPISIGLDGAFQTNSRAEFPVLDAAGQFVAFASTATNLVTNILSSGFHLYLRDLHNGNTMLVDSHDAPIQAVTAPCLSADGRTVAFECPDARLVPDDRNRFLDVFLRDRESGTFELISQRGPESPSITPNGPSGGTTFSSSADGRFIAFASDADDLVINDTNNCRDIFVRDLLEGSCRLVSVRTDGSLANAFSSEPAMSPDGRYVAFTSAADLAYNDGNRLQDVYLHDLQSGVTSLVSMNSGRSGSGNFASLNPQVSRGGRHVLFQSFADNLTPGIAPGTVESNLFLRDMSTGVNHALTTNGTLLSSMTPDGRLIAFVDQSARARIIVWDSLAATRIGTNLLPGATLNLAISDNGRRIAALVNSSPPALCLVDLFERTTVCVTQKLSAGARSTLRFSADGQFLAYSARPTTNHSPQVFLYDFTANNDLLLSTGFDTGNPGAGRSDSPDISPDGRFVAYRSYAPNLVSPSPGTNQARLYLYDRLTGGTRLLLANAPSASPVEGGPMLPVFSRHGRTLFFPAWTSGLVDLDSNNCGDLFALDLLYLTAGAPVPGMGVPLNWPARPGENYSVQFKDGLANPEWEQLHVPVSVTGNQAWATDPQPGNGPRFYRVKTQ